ncbi:MAG: type IV pilus biogenesis/stability protein PilW [Candidatus Thiodiazotropha sp. (ex Ustalcina ferruginea)]|nr:type IV pilus biogenesis/stability protein PilW [Candidatus Thiodiazotropha sp. (ex Ustalcina ferruginea)]
MKSFAGYQRLSAMLLMVLLIGCSSQEKVTDTTGNLGLEKRTSPAKIYVEMGMAYIRDGQSAIAMQKLKKALDVDDEFSEAHNVIAILYEQLGESGLAGEHYNRAVELDERDPFIRNARGSYYCRRGMFDEAGLDFQRALSNPLYPTPWVALTNAGLCVERTGDNAKAENFFRRALTANPQYATALFEMAEISLQQQKDLSARAYLERFHGESKPTAASLWLGVPD